VAHDPTLLRRSINEGLGLLADPRFELIQTPTREETWAPILGKHRDLYTEKRSFIDLYNYEWALDREAYNSSFEAFLQWRMLNVLSDTSPDHPALARCRDLVVRVVPTSCARPHMREVDGFRVLILTSGYLSAFKGFIRLWLRGCALGGGTSSGSYREQADCYLKALRQEGDRMALSAKAYVGTLFQLLNNEVPGMDSESIFDGAVLKQEDWQVPFGLLSNAIDGFVLFHEVTHVLEGDPMSADRSFLKEAGADLGSVSLCIIDEARGGVGTIHLGAPMFFCVEILRLMCEEILEIKEGRHSPQSGRYPGIEELMLRSNLYIEHIREYLGEQTAAGQMVSSHYLEWSRSMGHVFDTVRWAILHVLGNPIGLAEFVENPYRATPRSE